MAAVRAALLQALLSRRVVLRTEAVALHTRIAEAVGGPDQVSFDSDVIQLQSELARVGLELRVCNDERTAEAYVLLVNTKADALAEIATPYSAVELVYIKTVVEHVVMAPNARFAIASTRALQLASDAQLTKRAASDLLQNLEQRDWLHLTRSTGYYTLTLRALNELDSYLRNEFEEQMLECVSCFALVTHGTRCASDGCHAALHTACQQWVQTSGAAARACPLCTTPWHTAPVGA